MPHSGLSVLSTDCVQNVPHVLVFVCMLNAILKLAHGELMYSPLRNYWN